MHMSGRADPHQPPKDFEMKTPLFVVASAVLFLSSMTLSSIGEAKSIRACFAKRLPYFSILGQVETSVDDAYEALSTSCNEIGRDGMMEAKTAVVAAIESGANVFGHGVAGGFASRYSRMDSTPLQRKYMAEIKKIRRIENTMERVRQAYMLASRHSGKYDDSTLGMATLKSGGVVFGETPENLLNNFEKRGTVGVCREFASLLNWTLEQITRSPQTGKIEFKTQTVGGKLPGGRHEWVRVRFAQFGWAPVDFDTTYNQGQFIPLAPRREGLDISIRQRAYRECTEIIDCIEQENP